MLTDLPTRATDDLGPALTDERTPETNELSAVHVENLKDRIIEVATDIGIDGSPASGSIKFRLETLEEGSSVPSAAGQNDGQVLQTVSETPVWGAPPLGAADTLLDITSTDGDTNILVQPQTDGQALSLLGRGSDGVSGDAGAAVLQGGRGFGTADGADVFVQGGTSVAGSEGAIRIGDISGSTVNIGRSGIGVNVVDLLRFTEGAGAIAIENTGGGSIDFASPVTGPGIPSAPNATPLALGTAAIGASGKYADQAHVHAHGNQLGGTLHAEASDTAAGFQSAYDKDAMFESRKGLILVDDFHVGLTNTLFTALPAGAGSGVAQIASEDSHQGIVRATTGTTTTGSALVMRTQVANAIKLGGGLFEVLSYFRINQISTVGEEFDFQIGLDNANATPDSTGCYLSYRRLLRGTTFYGYGYNGSFHSQNTGVTVTAGQWVQHRMTIDSGLTVRHYIGVAGATPTLVATLPTSAPTALNSLTAKLIKTAGTTPVTVDYDLIGVRETFTAAR